NSPQTICSDRDDETGSADRADPPDSFEQDVARPPEFSDEALALRFAECHEGDLRYVAALGKWLVWDGTRWRFDETLDSRDHVRRICRAIAAGCSKDQSRIAKAIASAKTVAGVERLAQSDRRLAATIDQFDRDAFELNTPAGIIDLQLNQVRPHDPLAYFTKI